MRYGTVDIINIENLYDTDIDTVTKEIKSSIFKLFDELNDFFSQENIMDDKKWEHVAVSIDTRFGGKVNMVDLVLSSIWPQFFDPRKQIIFMPFDLGENYKAGYQIEVEYDDHIEKDDINPDHYKNQTSLECIEAMEIMFGHDMVIDFCICNAYKYIWRWKNKNGQVDLGKANWYLTRAYEMIDAIDKRMDQIRNMRNYLNIHKEE